MVRYFGSFCVLFAIYSIIEAKITDRRGPLNLSFSKMAVYNEDPCLRAGGQCLLADDCPEGLLTERGLCPEQKKRGVECCNGISNKVTTCKGLGGECSTRSCANDLIKEEATDCKPQEICCVLVG